MKRDPADEIALEHVLWAARDGQQPEDVMLGLGVEMKRVTWDDVLLALRISWRRLRHSTVAEFPEGGMRKKPRRWAAGPWQPMENGLV